MPRYQDVFVPGGFPKHTYNPRADLELEVRLYRGASNRRAGVEDIWQAVAPNDAGLAHRATAAEA